MGLFDRFKKSGSKSGDSPLDETTVVSSQEATVISARDRGADPSQEATVISQSQSRFNAENEETVISPGNNMGEETVYSDRPAFFSRPPKKSFFTRFFEMFKRKPRYDIPDRSPVRTGNRGGSGGSGGGFWTDGRPPFERGFIYALLLAMAYMTADLTLLANRDKLLPDEAPQAPPKLANGNNMASRGDYNRITQPNLFNSDGVIPDPLRAKDQGGQQQLDGPPIPTTLSQLTLVGTLVHINPKRSVATVEIKGTAPKILPFFVGDDIEGLAEVTKVERKKVIFRNRQSGRLEFIEIKDNSTVLFGRSKGEPAKGEIKQEGNNFSLKRDDLNANLKNINQILQQATAVPNIVPGSGGQIDGFRLIDIQPGSLYEKLGLKKNDVIKGVNGTTVDSANKAVELYNQLKNSSQIAIDIDRGGGHETLTYTVQ